MLRGFNCSVFAFGPTGTGKTHTMEGTSEDAGLAPRCAKALFARLEKQKTKAGEADFQIKASCLEIYNEELSDLFAVDDDTTQKTTARPWLCNHKDRKKGLSDSWKRPINRVTCANLEEVVCGDVDACLKGFCRKALRTDGSRRQNATTSRLGPRLVHAEGLCKVAHGGRPRLDRERSVEFGRSSWERVLVGRARRTSAREKPVRLTNHY